MIPAAAVRLQEAGPAAGRELPFWLFWFLLCVILLLVVFIVLRDKDLRRRMSSFLSGARRKMLRLRLQAKIRKQEAKRIDLLREIGEKAWDLDLRDEKSEPVRAQLEEIDKKTHREQMKWHELITEIERLNGRLQEIRRTFEESLHRREEERKPFIDEMSGLLTRKEKLMESFSQMKDELEAARTEAGSLEKEVQAVRKDPDMPSAKKTEKIEKIGEASASLGRWIKDTQGKIVLLEEEQARIGEAQKKLQSRIDFINEDIRRLDEGYRDETKALEDDIRGKEAERRRVEKTIIGLKESKVPLFESLGKAVEDSRPPNDELEILFLGIDGVKGAVRDLKAQIEKLG